MGIIIKTEKEIESMRKGGRILAEVLKKTCEMAKPGVSTKELDQFAEEFIRSKGARPSFKGYQGFPATLCTAINEVVVHGIPRENEILKEGDLLTIDCGVFFENMHTDAARSVGIGKISPEKQRLIDTANETLKKAIKKAKPGIHIGEISRIIEENVEKAGFKVIRDLTGHGVGSQLHESPIILNYFDGRMGPILKPGMTLAIEPIFSISTSEIKTLKDDWTIATMDDSCAVQAENTILITQKGSEVLTK